MTKADMSDFELCEDDLLGHSPDEIECVQCGGVFCGLRVGRIYGGKPLIMCSRKQETKEILAACGNRQQHKTDNLPSREHAPC